MIEIKIEVYSDWITVRTGNKTLFSGHSLGPRDLQDLLLLLDPLYSVEIIEHRDIEED